MTTTAILGVLPALLFATTSMAQTVPGPSAGPEASGGPGAAPPTSAGPQSTATVGEVVVTAQRRAENLQNVPIAVNAVSGANLVNAGVSNITDLKDVVPGINVQVANGFETTHLRGVGSTAVGPGLESPIALYVDNVYYGYPIGNIIDFVDVAQVEVLKGPQGTLFGRNATGGLIQVTTKEPNQTTHLDLGAQYGNYDTSKLSLYASGPITDKLAADIAAQVGHQGDGYGVDFFNGKDVYKTDVDLALRSKVVYKPMEGTKITTIFDYSLSRNSNNADRYTPGEVAVSLPIGPGGALVPVSGPGYGGSPWDVDSNVHPFSLTQSGGVSIRLDQDLPFANLSNTTAFRQTNNKQAFDLDGSSLPLTNIALVDRDHAFSEELQLQSKSSSALKWTAGVFYYHDDGKYAPGSPITFLAPFNPSSPISEVQLIGNQTSNSVAAYGQATYEVLPKTNLTFGARYSYERRTLSAYNFGEVGNTYNPVNGDIGPGVPIVIPGFPPGILPPGVVNKAKNFYRPTFRVSLDHRFSDELLAYASFNTGFKSGGFNTQTPLDPAFAAETLDAYEAGVKTDLLDRRLRIDVSGFYYSYSNIQVQKLELASSGIINGAKAEIYGADIDVAFKLTPDLTLTGGTELLHTLFLSFPAAQISVFDGSEPPTVGSVSGNRLPESPNAVVNLGADYRFTALDYPFTANVTYNYNTGWYDEPDNVIRQPNFSLLNASLRWTSINGRYNVRAFANNLTNTAVQAFEGTEAFGEHNDIYLPPRTYGVRVGYTF